MPSQFFGSPLRYGLATLASAALIYFAVQARPVARPIFSFSDRVTLQLPVERLARPAELTIDELSIKVELVEATVDDGEWYMENSKAVFLSESADLESPGNTIIYGHSTRNLFGNLKDV